MIIVISFNIFYRFLISFYSISHWIRSFLFCIQNKGPPLSPLQIPPSWPVEQICVDLLKLGQEAAWETSGLKQNQQIVSHLVIKFSEKIKYFFDPVIVTAFRSTAERWPFVLVRPQPAVRHFEPKRLSSFNPASSDTRISDFVNITLWFL